MKIKKQAWDKYRAKQADVRGEAVSQMTQYIKANGLDNNAPLVWRAYLLQNKYGSAAAALACEMYEATAAVQGVTVQKAEPAGASTLGETAKAVLGTKKTAPSTVPETVGNLVKQQAERTMLKNAARDGAEFAWIPSGDACAFCEMLASNGWQHASKSTANGEHADHIHPNCLCEFAVRFDGKSTVAGYDPDALLEKYENAEGDDWREKLNSLRREYYAVNKDKINAQKRAAYAVRVAEERNRGIKIDSSKALKLSRGKEIIAKKAVTGKYGMYVSDKATLKAQALNNIEKSIDDSIKKLGIEKNAELPQFVVLANDEIGSATFASYNYVQNQLFVRASMGNKAETIKNQKELGFAAPGDPNSTMRHEMIHWKDANNYRKENGEITSANKEEYLNYRQNQSKIELEKNGINVDNVREISKISGYARQSLLHNDYDEVYTEYRVKEKGRKK